MNLKKTLLRICSLLNFRRGAVIGMILTSSFLLADNVYRISPELRDDVFRLEILHELNPTSNETRFNLAMGYAYTGQIKRGWDILQTVSKNYAETVVSRYEPLTKSQPDNWIYPFKLGFGYYFLKDKEKAVNAFQLSQDRNPDNIWSSGFKALVLGDMGEVDEAISISKKILKKEKNAAGIHFLLAEGYRKNGEYLKFLSEMFIVGRLQSAQSRYEKKKKDQWDKRKEELRKEMISP